MKRPASPLVKTPYTDAMWQQCLDGQNNDRIDYAKLLHEMTNHARHMEMLASQYSLKIRNNTLEQAAIICDGISESRCYNTNEKLVAQCCAEIIRNSKVTL